MYNYHEQLTARFISYNKDYKRVLLSDVVDDYEEDLKIFPKNGKFKSLGQPRMAVDEN